MTRAIPLKPSTQVKGASGFDDIDIEIVDAIVHRIDYVKKDGTVVATNIPNVTLKFAPLGIEGAEPFKEDYSIGASVPSADGETESAEGEYLVGADPEKEYTGLTDNCKFGFFIAQLGKAGYPESKMDASVKKTLIGLKGHLRSIPGPKYGAKQDPVKVITKVISLPGEAGAAAVDTGVAVDRAKELIGKALAKKDKFTKVELGQVANKALDGKPEKVAVVTLVLDDKFLKQGAVDGLWSFEKGTVSKVADAAIEVSL